MNNFETVLGEKFGLPSITIHPRSDRCFLVKEETAERIVSHITTLETALKEAEETMRLMREQVRVSDEAFNFHLKRANELMEKCNTLEHALKECVKRCNTAMRLRTPDELNRPSPSK